MTTGVLPQRTVDGVLAELALLEDPRIRAVNERHGDDHGVNLTQLRAVAKSLRTDHELAGRLWETGDTAARLVAILISRPKRTPPPSWTRCCAPPASRRCTTGSSATS